MERITFLLTFMVCVSLSIASAINTGTNANADPAQGTNADPAQGTSTGSASGIDAGSASEVVETASREIPCKPILQDKTFIHGEYVYSFSENTATFTEAWMGCKSQGADLVTVADESERKLLGIYMQLLQVARVWYGAIKLKPENVFRTLDGIEVTRQTEIDSAGQDCLSFNPSESQSFELTLSHCSELKNFVCKIPLACYQA